MSSVARELTWVYLGVCMVTMAVSYTPGPVMQDFGPLVLSAVFLFGALALARRHGGAARFGIDLSGVLEAHPEERGLLRTIVRALPSLGRELGVAVLVSLLIFPPFVPLFKLWHGAAHPFTLHLPRAPLDTVLHQLVVVALPEEAMFRGYFQTRLEEIFPGRKNRFGFAISWRALLIQAVLFACLHFLVGFSPARLAVFFPALVFGLLRSARGGIGAAVWFHAFSNLLSEVLTRGYF